MTGEIFYPRVAETKTEAQIICTGLRVTARDVEIFMSQYLRYLRQLCASVEQTLGRSMTQHMR
jgi:hypothetical protein